MLCLSVLTLSQHLTAMWVDVSSTNSRVDADLALGGVAHSQILNCTSIIFSPITKIVKIFFAVLHRLAPQPNLQECRIHFG